MKKTLIKNKIKNNKKYIKNKIKNNKKNIITVLLIIVFDLN